MLHTTFLGRVLAVSTCTCEMTIRDVRYVRYVRCIRYEMSTCTYEMTISPSLHTPRIEHRTPALCEQAAQRSDPEFKTRWRTTSSGGGSRARGRVM